MATERLLRAVSSAQPFGLEMRHSFTIKGFIERGSPHIAWSISFIDADSIEGAIKQVQGLFTEKVMVSDVTRIMSRAGSDA